MSFDRLYLGAAWGWESDDRAKVAIAQLRNADTSYGNDCPERQLAKNAPYRDYANAVKIFGYIPGLNIVAGIISIVYSARTDVNDPNHTAKWICRGVAMILTGPLMFIVDLIKDIWDNNIIDNYYVEHAAEIAAFNSGHQHNFSRAPWPGHPIHCIIPET